MDAVATALLARSRALLRERDQIQQRIQSALLRFKPSSGGGSASGGGAQPVARPNTGTAASNVGEAGADSEEPSARPNSAATQPTSVSTISSPSERLGSARLAERAAGVGAAARAEPSNSKAPVISRNDFMIMLQSA